MNTTIFSVSYLARILEEVIRGSLFHNIYLRGEIQSKNTKGRYTYLTLIDSDKDQALAATMTVLVSPETNVQSPEYGIGDTVLLKGSLSYYKARSTVSFWADYLIIEGEGKELVRLKKLQEKLNREGLFAQEHKRELPLYPKGVGIITSSTGAAVNDVKDTLKKRYPCHIKVYSATVQGTEAAGSLFKALQQAMKDEDIDIILLTRGGGSKADLAPFNDEKIVRLLYASPYPVISAVGHQIDVSLTDLVADKTAITPTAAANLIGYSLNELAQRRYQYRQELKSNIKHVYDNKMYEFQNYVLQLNNLSPQNTLNNYYSQLSLYRQEINASFSSIITNAYNKYNIYKKDLFEVFKNYLVDKRHQLNQLSLTLEGLSPQRILNQGYAYATKRGKMISSVNDVETKDELIIHLKDGNVITEVK